MDVLMYGHPHHPGLTDTIKGGGGQIEAIEMVKGIFHIKVTTNICDILRFSTYVIITVPATAHDDIIDELAGFDLKRHKLIVCPSNFFSKYARKRSKLSAQFIFETSTAPYAVRVENGKLVVKDAKFGLEIGVFPKTASDMLRRQVERLFPKSIAWCRNSLTVGVSNIGPVIHVVTALMTAGKNRQFLFHRDGMGSPPIAAVILWLDWARRVIAKACTDEDLPSVTQVLETYYRQGYSTFMDFAEGSKVHNRVVEAPTDIQRHRYLQEEVPFVLVTWYELGCARQKSPELAKAVDIVKTFINLASLVNGVNYLETGRTLKKLGLHKASKGRTLAAFGEKRSWLFTILDVILTLSKCIEDSKMM